MKTKLLILLIAVVGFLIYFLFPRFSETPVFEGPIVTNVNQISDTLFQEETDRYNISISIPIITNDAAFLEIRNDVQLRVESFKELVNSYDGQMTAPWSLVIEFEEIQSDTITSYLVNWYEYVGGAHGNVVVTSYNYSIEKGERIDIEDITTSLDHLYTFAALADKELTVSYPEGSSGENPDNWRTWYADRESVTFVFSPYQIAAYSVGIQKFRMVATGVNANMFNQEYFNE